MLGALECPWLRRYRAGEGSCGCEEVGWRVFVLAMRDGRIVVLARKCGHARKGMGLRFVVLTNGGLAIGVGCKWSLQQTIVLV